MQYNCDMCKVAFEIADTKKLLDKRYCEGCISKARSERRKALERRKRLPAERKWRVRVEKSKLSLKSIKAMILDSGLKPLSLIDPPVRLKRNEQIYFLAGFRTKLALALTSQRLFIANTEESLLAIEESKRRLSVTPGIRANPLSAVIAIDQTGGNRFNPWTSTIHLESGKYIEICFEEGWDARSFHVLITELVDRLNDPIDPSVFSTKRERISNEIKVAVWRRDGGACARCGSRKKLEYDHIIPVAKGGSNTIRNIELLCETCNRSKSDRIV